MPDDAQSPVIPKQETQSRGSSASSIDSAVDIDAEGEADGHVSPSANAPVQKRKGGRKPVSDNAAIDAMSRDQFLDIRHLRRAEAKEPSGSGSFSGATNRIYQAAGEYHQATRDVIERSSAKSQISCR